jgi:hypothetical protein
MRQTTLSVPLEVKPESCSCLTVLIDALKQREDKGANPEVENFARIVQFVPTLHFMSMSVFPASEYDPIFILEANFDGAPGPFWGQLEAVLGNDLRAILRCCKRPLDATGALYDAVVAPGSSAPVAPYLEARTQRPSVFHNGNRGLTRARISDDYALFLAARDELDKPAPEGGPHYHSLTPAALHKTLRAAMLPGHGWLSEPVPKRISTAENLADWMRLIVYVVLALVVLSSPGLLLASLVPGGGDLAIMGVVALIFFGLTYLNRHGLPGKEIKSRSNIPAFLLGQSGKFGLVAVIYVLGASIVITPIVWLATHLLPDSVIGPALGLPAAFWPTVHVVLLGFCSLLLLTVPLLLFLVRRDEMADSSQDAPNVNDGMLRDMLQREDWVVQNHMGSIVLIKPGILRMIIIRAGHLGLFLVLRLVARDGYLGSMRTVHFAHWAFLNNGSRLLFFSNFDHSWGSYLDDFIEKAHGGLTLAWGCGVGFPTTRFLVLDGASHGRQFKNWALASRAVSRFWYSAYPDLTVDQVERNNRIANGLRRTSMTDNEATQWMLDL